MRSRLSIVNGKFASNDKEEQDIESLNGEASPTCFAMFQYGDTKFRAHASRHPEFVVLDFGVDTVRGGTLSVFLTHEQAEKVQKALESPRHVSLA